MSVGLSELLDKWLNSLRKHANRDWWKFNFKNAGVDKWNDFKDAMIANTTMFLNEFATALRFSDLDTLLELLVSKIVKAFCGGVIGSFVSLMKCWCSLDGAKALIVQDLVDSDASFNCIHSALSGAKKFYCALKLAESLKAKEGNIKSAIGKRMESFKIDKGHTIKSMLERPFHKVVLDHLVVDNELVLKPSLVKSKYRPLEHIFNGAFSGVMCLIDFDEFFKVVFNLSDGKAAGLLGISNELWKHCDKSVLDMLLVLLNCCLSNESVPNPWKKAWVSMIPKPYDFISVGVYNKWDTLIHKDLKLKSGLPLDFPSNTIHHLSFYGLKFFLQIQSKSKIASLVDFVNSGGILGQLFSHQSHDLQVWCWHPVHPLVSSVHTHVSVSNNFLADMNVHVCCSGVSVSSICPVALCGTGPLNILEFSDYVSICDHLSQVDASVLSVYTDGFLKDFGTVNCSASITDDYLGSQVK
ncbi:hypothetical protein G9A89_019387 [Geosiphon pyriformis]|nr:hypothetical protein G9A89_019387 [Geosiphon pyriformis]